MTSAKKKETKGPSEQPSQKKGKGEKGNVRHDRKKTSAVLIRGGKKGRPCRPLTGRKKKTNDEVACQGGKKKISNRGGGVMAQKSSSFNPPAGKKKKCGCLPVMLRKRGSYGRGETAQSPAGRGEKLVFERGKKKVGAPMLRRGKRETRLAPVIHGGGKKKALSRDGPAGGGSATPFRKKKKKESVSIYLSKREKENRLPSVHTVRRGKKKSRPRPAEKRRMFVRISGGKKKKTRSNIFVQEGRKKRGTCSGWVATKEKKKIQSEGECRKKPQYRAFPRSRKGEKKKTFSSTGVFRVGKKGGTKSRPNRLREPGEGRVHLNKESARKKKKGKREIRISYRGEEKDLQRFRRPEKRKGSHPAPTKKKEE